MSEWVCERESMNEYVSVCDSVGGVIQGESMDGTQVNRVRYPSLTWKSVERPVPRLVPLLQIGRSCSGRYIFVRGVGFVKSIN